MHALVAELGLQALGHPEHAAERADVLAHEQHLVVVLHRLAQSGVQGLRHREFGRVELRQPGRAHSSPPTAASVASKADS